MCHPNYHQSAVCLILFLYSLKIITLLHVRWSADQVIAISVFLCIANYVIAQWLGRCWSSASRPGPNPGICTQKNTSPVTISKAKLGLTLDVFGKTSNQDFTNRRTSAWSTKCSLFAKPFQGRM